MPVAHTQESEEQIDLDCTCIWIRLASGAATGDLTSSLIAPLPDRDAIQAATPSPADQRPARTHLAITSPHTETAAVVNIATGVVSLVDIPRHERQQQQRHSARLPPPHAMGVQPWSPSPTPRHRPTASCSDSVVEGTAGKQSGAKGGSAETAERNPGPNLELHLEKSRSLDQQLLGIWDTLATSDPSASLQHSSSSQRSDSGLYYLPPESLRPPVTSASAARARQERGARSDLGARSARGKRGARNEPSAPVEREVRSASHSGARSARAARAAWSFPTTTHQLHISEPGAVWAHPSGHTQHPGHAFARSPRSCNDPIRVRTARRDSSRAVACATSPPRPAASGRENNSTPRPPSPRPAAQLHHIQTGCFRSSVATRAASDHATSQTISPARLYCSSRAAVHLGLTQPGFFGEGRLATTRPSSSFYDARPLAFGSRRPQRPAHVALMSSAAGDATALRSPGSAPSVPVRGIF